MAIAFISFFERAPMTPAGLSCGGGVRGQSGMHRLNAAESFGTTWITYWCYKADSKSTSNGM